VVGVDSTPRADLAFDLQIRYRTHIEKNLAFAENLLPTVIQELEVLNLSVSLFLSLMDRAINSYAEVREHRMIAAVGVLVSYAVLDGSLKLLWPEWR